MSLYVFQAQRIKCAWQLCAMYQELNFSNYNGLSSVHFPPMRKSDKKRDQIEKKNELY